MLESFLFCELLNYNKIFYPTPLIGLKVASYLSTSLSVFERKTLNYLPQHYSREPMC